MRYLIIAVSLAFMANSAFAASSRTIQLFPSPSLRFDFSKAPMTHVASQEMLRYTQEACEQAVNPTKVRLPKDDGQTITVSATPIKASPFNKPPVGVRVSACKVHLLVTGRHKTVLNRTYSFAPDSEIGTGSSERGEVLLKLVVHSFAPHSSELIILSSENEGGTASPSGLVVYRLSAGRADRILSVRTDEEATLTFQARGNALTITGPYDDGTSADCCMPIEHVKMIYNPQSHKFGPVSGLRDAAQKFLAQIDPSYVANRASSSARIDPKTLYPYAREAASLVEQADQQMRLAVSKAIEARNAMLTLRLMARSYLGCNHTQNDSDCAASVAQLAITNPTVGGYWDILYIAELFRGMNIQRRGMPKAKEYAGDFAAILRDPAAPRDKLVHLARKALSEVSGMAGFYKITSPSLARTIEGAMVRWQVALHGAAYRVTDSGEECASALLKATNLMQQADREIHLATPGIVRRSLEKTDK